jgi:hypothetical protein
MKKCSYIYVCVVIKSGSECRTSNSNKLTCVTNAFDVNILACKFICSMSEQSRYTWYLYVFEATCRMTSDAHLDSWMHAERNMAMRHFWLIRRALVLSKRAKMASTVTTWLEHMTYYCSKHCPMGKCTYLGAWSSKTQQQHR